MRLSTMILPAALAGLALAGCDRAKPAASQASETAAVAPTAPAVSEVPQTISIPTSKVDRSHAGQPEPATPFVAPDGTPATLAAFRGHPLLVNLWATWCAPCVREMPTLDALAAKPGAVQVMAVSQDLAGKREVDPYFAKAGLKTLKPYLDKQNVLMEGLKVDTLPTTVLYDGQGREVWRVTGAMDWTGADAAKLIGEAKG